MNATSHKGKPSKAFQIIQQQGKLLYKTTTKYNTPALFPTLKQVQEYILNQGYTPAQVL